MGIMFSAKCNSSARLDGKTVIVTGSNTGIGKCTVRDLYKRGAKVIMACRSLDKAEKARDDILNECKSEQRLGMISLVHLDLTSLESVRKCAQNLLKDEEHIDVLINNAGIMFCPLERTEDGFEMQLASNHLGHFLFTLLLLPKMIKSAPARIINISSLLHAYIFGDFQIDDLNWENHPYHYRYGYYHSKLANILFSKELAKRLKDANIEGVTTYSLHPGVINTELSRHLDKTMFRGSHWFVSNISSFFLKTPEQGCQTTIHCAVDENAGKETGLYYAECKPTQPSSNAQNVEYAKKLWDISLKMVGLEENYDPFTV